MKLLRIHHFSRTKHLHYYEEIETKCKKIEGYDLRSYCIFYHSKNLEESSKRPKPLLILIGL